MSENATKLPNALKDVIVGGLYMFFTDLAVEQANQPLCDRLLVAVSSAISARAEQHRIQWFQLLNPVVYRAERSASVAIKVYMCDGTQFEDSVEFFWNGDLSGYEARFG